MSSSRSAFTFAIVIAIAACNSEPKHSDSMTDVDGQLGGTGGNAMTTQAPVASGTGGSSSAATTGSGGAMSGAGAHPATVPTNMGDAGKDASGGPKDAGTTDSGDAAAAPDQDSGPMPTMHEDLGVGDGRDVVLLGDSWMSNTLQIEGTGGGIAPSLIQVSGQPYTNYGVQGVMLLMADAFGPAIPTQYESAKQFQPGIKTVVMTGGGNDVIQNPTLQASCMMNGPECKQLGMDIVAALDKLWSEMSADGVQDVIYIRYAKSASSSSSDTADAGAPPAPPQICLKGPIRCHSVDTTDLVAATDLAADGIHPLFTANQRIAERVFDLMTKEGMRR